MKKKLSTVFMAMALIISASCSKSGSSSSNQVNTNSNGFGGSSGSSSGQHQSAFDNFKGKIQCRANKGRVDTVFNIPAQATVTWTNIRGTAQPGQITSGDASNLYLGQMLETGDIIGVQQITSGGKLQGYNILISSCIDDVIIFSDRQYGQLVLDSALILNNNNYCGFGTAVTQDLIYVYAQNYNGLRGKYVPYRFTLMQSCN